MIWQIKPRAPSAFFKQFPEYPRLISQLFYNRGLKNQEQVDEFFNSDYQTDLHDPFLLKGMKKAVQRINQAIKKQEKITVYGDFDADGICAASIIYLTLEKLGLKNLSVYIPDRDKENHGLNEQSVRELAQGGTKLIIAVDCASTDLKEAELAHSLGLDLIIADHHETAAKLPQVVAFINPLQKGDRYPFKNLSGAGVAYKLASALLGQEEPFKKWLLDLAAIAAVADVMPIIGENRTLVKYGLGVLAQTRWLGLVELMKIAQISPQVNPSSNGEAPTNNLSVYTLSHILGPRLNAASRIDHADKAFRLLITRDQAEAQKLAQEINQNNLERQNRTERVFQEVENRLKNFNQETLPKLIFEGSPDWSVGLVGLVASKIREKYCRPAVIYQEKNGRIAASCRSIPQFDLMEMLRAGADFFEDFGGRNKATGGFRMRKEKLATVREIFERIAEEKLSHEDLRPILEIDAEISLEEINWPTFDRLQQFAPFGRVNPEPRFVARGLEVSESRLVGNNNGHLKMELIMFDKNDSEKIKKFKAIGFGLKEWDEKIKKGDLIDAVFEIIANEWNGYRDLELKIIDMKHKT